MECPRCGEELERYALQGREAFVCTACGYIGVPVEHRGEYEAPESWDDAISRFHDVDRVESVTIETTEEDPTPEFIDDDGEPLDPAFVRIDTGNGTEASTNVEFACTVCGETFDSRAALDGHSAVHTDEENEA
ncbi:zf-TFIIB domain-containing protein [Natronomonas amylolytica]|uniref:zf-TFIIB domain-containing protein n=1 Tax=Natronomonas amylolytica TaxID=3108498 RepID=UPI00300AF175